MDEDATLSLPEDWTETRFERGSFGPGNRDGFAAEVDGPDATLAVVPVSYRRQGGVEMVTALQDDWTADRDDPSVPLPDVDPTTGFATRLTFTPFDTVREEVVCVAADAGDALAVAVWLAGVASDARDLRRHVNVHAGSGSPTGASLSDDDVLAAALSDGPERCVYTGQSTSSHLTALPYRYAPLLSGARRTSAGVPRFPSTVGVLVGAVSHGAWEEHDLGDVPFDAPVERTDPGAYRLHEDVVDAVAGTDFEAYALRRLGVVG